MKKEGKRMYSYRVPESLYEEIDRMVKLRINDYERRLLVEGNVEKKLNPADVVIEAQAQQFDYDNLKTAKEISSRITVVESYDAKKIQTNTDEPTQYVKPTDVKKDKVKALQEMADLIKNGGGGKSMSFTTVKKPIDEIYDCIIVEKGIPVESDRIYYGTNNRIAFWDRDDASVFYANWDDKYYQFANSKEFNKFCKDNQIK